MSDMKKPRRRGFARPIDELPDAEAYEQFYARPLDRQPEGLETLAQYRARLKREAEERAAAPEAAKVKDSKDGAPAVT